jgi:hypothetical protein
MGWWIFKSAREKALDHLRKDVSAMYKLAKDDYEDAEIADLADQVAELKQLFMPEEEIPRTPTAGLPPEMIDAVTSLIPEQWRGMARPIIRRILTDPKTMQEIQTRLMPFIGRLPTTPPATQQQPIAQHQPPETIDLYHLPSKEEYFERLRLGYKPVEQK